MSYDEDSGKRGHSRFHNVYLHPDAYQHFKKTGGFPEKTILAMEVFTPGSQASINRQGSFEDRSVGLEAAVKDSSRFDESWAYFSFTESEGKLKTSATAFARIAAGRATTSTPQTETSLPSSTLCSGKRNERRGSVCGRSHPSEIPTERATRFLLTRQRRGRNSMLRRPKSRLGGRKSTLGGRNSKLGVPNVDHQKGPRDEPLPNPALRAHRLRLRTGTRANRVQRRTYFRGPERPRRWTTGRRCRARNEGDRSRPGEPPRLSFRASLHESAGRFSEAIEDYDRLVELLPRNSDVYNQRGSAHFKAGHIDESINDFDRSIKLERARSPTIGSAAFPTTTPADTTRASGSSSPIKPSIPATSKTPFGTICVPLAYPAPTTPARNCFPSVMTRVSR